MGQNLEFSINSSSETCITFANFESISIQSGFVDVLQVKAFRAVEPCSADQIKLSNQQITYTSAALLQPTLRFCYFMSLSSPQIV